MKVTSLHTLGTMYKQRHVVRSTYDIPDELASDSCMYTTIIKLLIFAYL